MNLRDLDYICAVDDYRHFGKAADACHVSQPTLSGQIKKLEAYLGVSIFERTNRSVRVTEVGADIIAVARTTQNAVTRIKTIAETARDPMAGTLRLGLIPTIAPYLIPLFAENAHHEFPKLSIIYNEDITERLNADLLSGHLHAAILATEPESEQLATIPLYSEPFWLIYPQGHRLTKTQPLFMRDVSQDEILLLAEGHCFRDQALSICNPIDTHTPQALRATSLETLINLVAAGQGLTLVPALAMNSSITHNSALNATQLSDRQAARTIYLTYRKAFPRKAAIEALSRLIKTGLTSNVETL